MRGETWLSAMQWNANPMAHPKVSTSPKLMDEKSRSNLAAPFADALAAGAVSSTIPAKASAAPTHAFHRGAFPPGGRKPGMDENSGTSTTTNPVMNADFEGVVRTRPMV